MNRVQNSNRQPQKQAIDPIAVWVRIKRNHPNLTGLVLAKRLHRSPSAVYRALKGKKPVLLGRIVRHLDYLEKQKAKKSNGM